MKRIHIIAEMACSHEGKTEFAYKIIDGAGQAGADAIQFQIWKVSEMVVPHHPDYETLLGIELSRPQWAELAAYVRERYPHMQIIACVYEQSSADFAVEIGVDAYKLHSADLSNPGLVKHVAATRKRIDLSVGGSSLEEIQNALEWIRETSDAEVWLMYGYQRFPTSIDDVHLDYMMKLKALFELPLGYQDHCDGGSEAGFWIPAAAVGMGVDILEKHITHDRAYKGLDHQSALNPDEFVRFVQMVRDIERARGVAVPKPFSQDEQWYRKYSKKSLVASRDLPEGSTVSASDVVAMRAAQLGLPPDQAPRLLGKQTRRDLRAFELIQEQDIAS